MGLIASGQGVMDFPKTPAFAPSRGLQNFGWEGLGDSDLVSFFRRVGAKNAAGHGLVEGRMSQKNRTSASDQLGTDIVGQRRPYELVLHDEGENRLQDGVQLVAEPEEMENVSH